MMRLAKEKNILDIEQPSQLLDYLRDKEYIHADERVKMRRLDGGVSNRTVWVGHEGGEAWVIKQALEKLRVPTDWFSSPERIGREALGIRWLETLAPAGAITPLIFEDSQHYLLAMAAVPQPHDNWKSLLLTGRVEYEQIEQFGYILGTIHRNSYLRRAEVAPIFDNYSWFESLRLEPYYQVSAERVPAAAHFLKQLIDATRMRRLTLVHGDYSPKNVLIYRGRLILLDHEVIHWGDPAFDVGFALTHLLSKAHHLTQQRARFAQAARLFWDTYQRTVGEASWAGPLEIYAVRHTLACLLARVVGRSPLEYLSECEKSAQCAAAVALMDNPPGQICELIPNFLERIEADAAD